MPRKFNIRENLCGRGDFSIKDESGQKVYKVQSKRLTINDKLVLQDAAGNPLMKIRQENFPRYSIYSADTDQEIAVVKKMFSFLHPKFAIESIYGEYILKSPEIMSRSFTLEKNETIVATVSKELATFTDCYGIEIIDDNEDSAFILALAIVIDQFLFSGN
uniref:LURP-one-related family protein n=1 Tax=Panagrolaimus sp. ES5 TaxID=591445 RepID=A0AC34FVZ2_9BILA